MSRLTCKCISTEITSCVYFALFPVNQVAMFHHVTAVMVTGQQCQLDSSPFQ